jgi:hypothetical protein
MASDGLLLQLAGILEAATPWSFQDAIAGMPE